MKLPKEKWNSPGFSYVWNLYFDMGEYAIWCKINNDHEVVYKITDKGIKPDEDNPGTKYIGGLVSRLHASYE